MIKEKILIVDDEKDIVKLIDYNLSKEGYYTLTASSAEEALKKLEDEKIDLVVLDLMLPGMDGYDLTKKLKNSASFSDIPIIMLTAKGEEPDIITGLELGADDYITKPFSPRILIARIKAILRRHRDNTDKDTKELLFEEIKIYPEKIKAYIKDEEIGLTYNEFQILSLFVKNPGRVFSRFSIVENVHGCDYSVTDRTIDVHIASLRKKMKKYGTYIETVWGAGYRFKEN